MKSRSHSVRHALPWLIACLHAATWADPMRPLVLPAAASAPATGAAAVDRNPRVREPDGPREPERLVAIRQDSTNRWLALFGEKWVRTGDRIENYIVGAIDGNTVQLADGKQRRTLHLLPPLVRPGAANAAAPPPDRTTDPADYKPIARTAPRRAEPSTDLAQANAAVLTLNRANGQPTP
jgi:hypothetical protein